MDQSPGLWRGMLYLTCLRSNNKHLEVTSKKGMLPKSNRYLPFLGII
jgi:hypothetical protein